MSGGEVKQLHHEISTNSLKASENKIMLDTYKKESSQIVETIKSTKQKFYDSFLNHKSAIQKV